MGTILDKIIEYKRSEIDSLAVEWSDWSPPVNTPARRDFRSAVGGDDIALIAEFKRRSPSRGEIRPGADPVRVVRAYAGAGAAAVSVLTDEHFFGGGFADLSAVRSAVSLPILRKDFIVDPCQIARSAGAEGPDCLLLIAAALNVSELRALRELAARCGQACLVEVHNEAELDRALEGGAELIGINNRDLKTFEVSLDTTIALRPHVPEGVPVVAESGIHTADDVRRLVDAGVDAMLVGEALMAAEDPAHKIEELLGER